MSALCSLCYLVMRVMLCMRLEKKHRCCLSRGSSHSIGPRLTLLPFCERQDTTAAEKVAAAVEAKNAGPSVSIIYFKTQFYK